MNGLQGYSETAKMPANGLKLQTFGEWLSHLSNEHESITLKLLNGDTVPLYPPLHFGDGFLTGVISLNDGDRVAVRFDAIASVRGYSRVKGLAP
jgi:hypothetical protein